jgi:hypothetical protein
MVICPLPLVMENLFSPVIFDPETGSSRSNKETYRRVLYPFYTSAPSFIILLVIPTCFNPPAVTTKGELG